MTYSFPIVKDESCRDRDSGVDFIYMDWEKILPQVPYRRLLSKLDLVRLIESNEMELRQEASN